MNDQKYGETCFKISNQNGKASIPYAQSGCSDCQGRDIDPWAKSRRRFTWHSDKESTCQWRRYKRHGFSAWVKKMPWRRKWKPAPVLLPRKFHKQRSLVGLCIFHRLWNCKELDVTEHTHTHSTFSIGPFEQSYLTQEPSGSWFFFNYLDLSLFLGSFQITFLFIKVIFLHFYEVYSWSFL